MSKILRVLREELAGIHLRLLLARAILAVIPQYVGVRMRPFILRLVGFKIGRGVAMFGTPRITGEGNIYRNLVIGQGCWFNIDVFLEASDTITIADQAGLGHQVMVLTSTHEFGPPSRRVGRLFTQPVHIGAGVWIGSRSTILPGVTIGDGAVVAAGALVTKNVPPNTVVAGVPAKVIRELSPQEALETMRP